MQNAHEFISNFLKETEEDDITAVSIKATIAQFINHFSIDIAKKAINQDGYIHLRDVILTQIDVLNQAIFDLKDVLKNNKEKLN